MSDSGQVCLVGIGLPKAFLGRHILIAVPIAKDSNFLLVLYVSEAKFNVLASGHFSIEFEEGVVIFERFLSWAGSIQIGEANRHHLIAILFVDAPGYSRVEHKINVLGLVCSVVDVMGHCEYEVRCDEEASSPAESVVGAAIMSEQLPDAVVGEFLGCGFGEAIGNISKIELVIVLIAIVFLHLIYHEISIIRHQLVRVIMKPFIFFE
jgi:hypothetical protein